MFTFHPVSDTGRDSILSLLPQPLDHGSSSSICLKTEETLNSPLEFEESGSGEARILLVRSLRGMPPPPPPPPLSLSSSAVDDFGFRPIRHALGTKRSTKTLWKWNEIIFLFPAFLGVSHLATSIYFIFNVIAIFITIPLVSGARIWTHELSIASLIH